MSAMLVVRHTLVCAHQRELCILTHAGPLVGATRCTGTRRSATHTLAIDSPPRRMSPPPLRPYRDHVVDLTHTNRLSAHPIAIKTLPFPCRVSTTPPQSVIAAALTSTYLCSLPQPPNTSSTFHRTSSILLTHLLPFTAPRFAEF